MEPSIIADLIARLLAIPADKVTFAHFLFLAMGIFGLALPGLVWSRNQARHVQFIREATPEQLAAYMGSHKLPPPKAPSLGGPVVILGLLLLVGLARGGVTLAASEESRPECTSDKQSQLVNTVCGVRASAMRAGRNRAAKWRQVVRWDWISRCEIQRCPASSGYSGIFRV